MLLQRLVETKRLDVVDTLGREDIMDVCTYITTMSVLSFSFANS